MILFHNASDEEIIDFYAEIRETLQGKDYQIMYLKTEDIPANIDVIRKERSDAHGNELWFPLMLAYFDESPYAKEHDVSGEAAMLEHFAHRQELELKICRDLFDGRYTVLQSKRYGEEEL